MINITTDTLMNESILTALSFLVTTASVITAITDTPQQDGLWRRIYRLIELIALVNDKTKQQ